MDADLADGEAVVQPHGKPRTTLDEVGWAEVLGTYRPFLSYNELGSMLDEGRGSGDVRRCESAAGRSPPAPSAIPAT